MGDITRRQLVGLGSAAAGLAAAAMLGPGRSAAAEEANTEPAPAPEGNADRPTSLRILMLGGTVFLGPATVDAALERGHEVTLFNRGRSNTHLYPELERLKGDRNGQLDALKDRRFDVAIDTSAYHPTQMRASMAILADAVEHYVNVSTISVYPGFGTDPAPIDEKSPTAPLPDPVPAKMTGATYGALKAACEREAEAAMPGRVANVRPGLIVGPRDGSDRFTYWPVRFARGGDVVVPDAGDHETSFIDVRDLGAWMVHLAEQRIAGVMNATGFGGPCTFRDLIHGARAATHLRSTVHWIDQAFLQAQGVRPWRDLPFWIPPTGAAHIANKRAIAAGLTFRPIAETLRDTLTWFEAEGGREQTRVGLTAAKEAEVLAAWRAR